MDKARVQEIMVSDAVTEKPIEFSVTVKEEVVRTEEREYKFKHYYLFTKTAKVQEDVKGTEDVEHKFVITPPTLGKMQVLSKYYLLLDIDEDKLQEEPHVEAMRICESKTDIVCSLMAVATFDTKADLNDDSKIQDRADFFKWNTKPQDFSTVLLALLTQTNYVNFMNSIRLTKLLRQNEPSKKEQANRVE